MDEFVAAHRSQLEMLHIPDVLFGGLYRDLSTAFLDGQSSSIMNWCPIPSSQQSLITGEYGSILVLPHILEWNMTQHQGLIQALQRVSTAVLRQILEGLETLASFTHDHKKTNFTNDDDLVNAIADHPVLWSRVILFRSSLESGLAVVKGALPMPPYFPQRPIYIDTEADLTGPFPFQYHHPTMGVIDLSLVYVSPGVSLQSLPTMDLVPAYQCPDGRLRPVRYAALLHGTNELPKETAATVKQIYAESVHDLHLIRQQSLERQQLQSTLWKPDLNFEITTEEAKQSLAEKLLHVYTDANDPMQLRDPIAGLAANSPYFVLVDSPEDADIIFSFSSVFAPNNPLKEILNRNSNVFINQFPYEGCLVQKDHLAREILKQHGLPRPSWALETYDLDEHMAEFVGAVYSETLSEQTDDAESSGNRSSRSLWIIKPAAGTQSQGHLVTRSLSHMLRWNDAWGGGRVAQRYVGHPVCIDGRKVDCRFIVMMPSAGDSESCTMPILYMHKDVYFRIANKEHEITSAQDLADHERVLTATHLLRAENRTSSDELRLLPEDHETIARLEELYNGKSSAAAFDWKGSILPQIQTMIRELFNGMTFAYPAMGQSRRSRALYGVDIIFQIEDVESDNETMAVITPKLTEVTFCPANNAVCDAYARKDRLHQNYNKEIFECLFLGKVSENIIRLQ
jgi:hypothetical protein